MIDDGTGIPEADLPRLFEDYVQGTNHGDETRGGFGLGLASVQLMTALMAGRVALDRRWRHGSAFYLEFGVSPDESIDGATQKQGSSKE